MGDDKIISTAAITKSKIRLTFLSKAFIPSGMNSNSLSFVLIYQNYQKLHSRKSLLHVHRYM